MAEIHIYVLQSPRILMDNQLIILPYKKAEALLYYLAIQKKVTREHAAALLWDTCEEATAKKNLRHALYTIRKTFHMDLIISSDRHSLCLNPEINFSVDYDVFRRDKKIDMYGEGLLNDFYVKNAYLYEEWMTWKRNQTRDSYLKLLEEQLQCTDVLSEAQGEALFEKYMREDSLDEQAYYNLMKIYEKQQSYYKGVRLYQRLSATLNMELKVAPGSEVRRLYEKFLEHIEQENGKSQIEEIPESRKETVKKIQNAFGQFMGGKPQSVLLTGESGSGKTYLMEQLLKKIRTQDMICIKTICMETEQYMEMQSWNIAFMQLAEVIKKKKIYIEEKYLQAVNEMFPFFKEEITESLLLESRSVYGRRAFRNLLLHFLIQAAKQIPLVLFFDNIQYMDETSADFLSLLIRTNNSRVMVLLTASEHYTERLKKYIPVLVREKYISRVSIAPFTKEDVEQIAENKLGKQRVNKELIKWLYEESEGNAFFLEMLLNECEKGNYKVGDPSYLQKLLKEQLDALSRETRQVLELIACCQVWADMDSLEHILQMDSLSLLERIDELKEKGFICEKVREGQIRFYICHGNMGKFVHEQMPPSKMRVFHSRLAEYIESQPSYDSSLKQRLIYHFTFCGNRAKVLKYKIYSLAEYSGKFYELYPVHTSSWNKGAFSDENILEECQKLEQEVLELHQQEPENKEYVRLYILLLQTEAQYCIPQGYYERGVECVEKALLTNDAYEKNRLVTCQCLRFLIYHQLNVWELKDTPRCMKMALQVAREGEYRQEQAVIERLCGLYLSMIGEFSKSMEYLEKSLNYFQSQPLKSRIYALNISACYNYMGENMRKTKQFFRAIEYYEKSAKVCEDNQCTCNAVVYSNLGRTYFALGQMEKCRQAFYKAEKLYEESFTLIGRSMTKAYIALLAAESGEWEQAVLSIQEAEETAWQLASPYTLGILNGVKAKLKREYGQVFGFVLEDEAECYEEQAWKYLEKIPGAYESENVKRKNINDPNPI